MQQLTKRTRIFLIIVLAYSTAVAACAATAREEKSAAGHRLFVLQNESLTVVLDLTAGARIVEYTYAPFGENVVYDPGSNGGILMDHVWEQTWPGEFLARTYEGEIAQAGPAEAVVRVWTTGEGETIKGVRLQRTLTLTGDARVLHCQVALQNTSKDGRVTGYWSQNNFWLNGTRDGVVWYVPGTRGIRTPIWWTDDPTAGWIGTASANLPGGLMFLMEYNDLWRPYPNGLSVTTEWFYDKVAIPAGKTWTTDIYIIPSKGNHGYKYGSQNLVANFQVDEEPGGLKITHELTQGLQPLSQVTLKTKARGLKATWSVEAETRLDQLDETVAVVPVKLTGTGAMPAGIHVTMTGTTADGRTVTETYGDYFGGSGGVNNDPFTMQPYLKFDRPLKRKHFLKPDVIAYTPNAKPRILYLRGIWHEFFRVDEALTAQMPAAEVVTGWLRSSPVGLGLSTFPADYPSLLGYDLIVLGNIPAAPLDMVGQEMLADYLQAGGNVLILGGDRAFGQAGFTNERLLAALPVDVGGTYNWRKILGGGALAVAADSPTTAGVIFGATDMVYYSHLCTPRKDATVAVTAGERPILVLGSAPKGGRIACVLATPFGEATNGETAFWDSAAWKRLMGNTVQWLVKQTPNP
ncbi:MAG TPA: hypothetical protein PLZ36_01645 [Armatimonadota bacterium]|nr:hypothetical protein [Armatimonadota bacterium]